MPGAGDRRKPGSHVSVTYAASHSRPPSERTGGQTLWFLARCLLTLVLPHCAWGLMR